MSIIDLRSDTVTEPTPQMRKAMYEAELGDDVYGEDPTVNRLEKLAAELFNKEAALLVSSGTQGNLVALLTGANRGEVAAVGSASHIFNYEAMGASALGGIGLIPLATEHDGTLHQNSILAAIPPKDDHKAQTRVLCIENTHNLCSGRALAVAQIDTMSKVAHSNGLQVHLDGARLFNASVAVGETVAQLTANVDSVTFCLSKGLSCPVGSVLVGESEFIRRARRWRKTLGSGMRQAGVIAAAGLVALETMVDRLAEDHANALRLARGLAEIEGIVLEPEEVETNIVFFEVANGKGAEFCEILKQEGILLNGDKDRLRLVTHYGIEEQNIDYTITTAYRASATLGIS